MNAPVATPRTVEELYELPDDGLHYELQAGWLLAEPAPGFAHGWIAGRVATLLSAFVRPRDLGAVVTCDTGFVLARAPDTVRCPDVGFVVKQRVLAVEDLSKAFPGPPDLAIEVVSPSQTRGAMHAKVADYLAAGTRLVWVIDPDGEQVTVYRDLLAPRRLHGEDVVDGEDVLPGFRVAAREFFEP